MNKGQDMNQQKQKDFSGVKGFLTIMTRDINTGEIVDYFSDKNVVTNTGVSKLIGNLTGSSDLKLDRFVFGDDVGTGNELVPESAKESYTSSRQDELLTVLPRDIVITNSGDSKLLAESTLSGSTVINDYFPTSVSVNLTSATFRFDDGTTFSYKRFPAIVISRMVDIIIQWEIEFTNDCN